jgi:hypothetical protein
MSSLDKSFPPNADAASLSPCLSIIRRLLSTIIALIYDILPDVNKNIIRRNFWHGKTKLITLSAIYPAPCQQSGKDGI